MSSSTSLEENDPQHISKEQMIDFQVQLFKVDILSIRSLNFVYVILKMKYLLNEIINYW